MSTTKLIKRYTNRKLYDTEQSKYVTLKDIVEDIAAGSVPTIIDNVTKQDVTGVVLLSAIVGHEDNLNVQVTTLCDIVKAGGLSKYVENLKSTNS